MSKRKATILAANYATRLARRFRLVRKYGDGRKRNSRTDSGQAMTVVTTTRQVPATRTRGLLALVASGRRQ